MRLYGIRGATRCANDGADMMAKVAELYDRLVGGNGLEEDNLVSIIFTVTEDLDAANPAAMLRASGRAASAPLFCAAEPRVAGSPRGLVRVLVHCYAPGDRRPAPAYINGAESLRPDLGSAAGLPS